MYRFDWLATRVEEPVDAERVIVDPHHHLWDNRGGTYQAAELLSDTRGGHNVTHTVFVECHSKYDRDAEPHLRPVGETHYVAAQAADTERLSQGATKIAGIVSFADMTLGAAVEEVLAAHDEAGLGLFRGIRHAVSLDPHPDVPDGHSAPTPGMMTTPEFIAGVTRLGQMGFTYDAWQYHPQLPDLVELARAAPETTIILDHLGGPMGIGPYGGANHGAAMAQWRADMAEVATCDNVMLKVGGIGMDNYYGTGFGDLSRPPSSDDVASLWGDRVRFCIDTFGPDRCMLESNFPVDRQTLTYTVLWNALQKMVAGYDEAEKTAMFSGTATRVYRLDI
jgi:predicted TIM-barrel fold metal-dependent hydrolase